MILPIVAYGSPILRKTATVIDDAYTDLDMLLKNMWETMYNSNGVGIAAPQINKSIRIFLVDTAQIFNNLDDTDEENIAMKKYPDNPGIKKAFINPTIINTSGKEWSYNEGCLSIPKIREDIARHEQVTLQYQNEQFEIFKETFAGVTARVILHEYDHLEGKLFIDYLSPLKKKLIKGKLTDITNLKVKTDYRMIVAK
jgi:peptide deformylase